MPDPNEQRLIDEVAKFVHDPLGHAQFVYPWGTGELEGEMGPRDWQVDVLRHIGGWLDNPMTRHQPCRVSVSSGHGIGKSALIAMIVKWALDTMTDTKVVVTANTEPQLRTKTWPELAKWFRLAITHAWHIVTATSAYTPGEMESSWRANAATWSEHNTEAFQGLHNKGRRIVVIYDEASGIADKVWEVTEGALTDEGTEIIWIAFGNPTRAMGRFRECFRKFRKLWWRRQIDSRDVHGTNKLLFEQWEDTYGADSDFFKVRCRGLFPAMSAKQFISEADIDAAFGRKLRPASYEFAPKVITLDGAWEGDDDLVIGMRQGLAFQILLVMPKNDNDVEVANILARFCDEHKPTAVFIDGGYGTGVFSVGKTMGYPNWILVWFSGKPSDSACFNKRAEMYRSTRDWLKEGGALPEDTELRDELQSIESSPRLDNKLLIVPKDAIKKTLGRSPNRADVLALSFGGHVHQPDEYERAARRSHKASRDHNPLDAV